MNEAPAGESSNEPEEKKISDEKIPTVECNDLANVRAVDLRPRIPLHEEKATGSERASLELVQKMRSKNRESKRFLITRSNR